MEQDAQEIMFLLVDLITFGRFFHKTVNKLQDESQVC